MKKVKMSFQNLELLSDENKKNIKGGSLWTAALATTLISSTVMNFIQMIYNLVNALTNKNETNSQNTNSSSSLTASTLVGESDNYVRLSNYPSKTAFTYKL